ncbi:ACT domain-containing protein [Brevibacillus centrosporus]|uniref:ACT domain-containing protein n=1 Tax=Brevibacillus centrosporus TaxID=54910 RepID=UPI0037FD69A9
MSLFLLVTKDSEISFPVKTNLLDSVIEVLENHQDALQFESFTSINDVVKISIIGSRRESHAGILNQITTALQEQDISIIWVYKNIHRVSIAVSKQVAEKALQILHRELHERKDHATP